MVRSAWIGIVKEHVSGVGILGVEEVEDGGSGRGLLGGLLMSLRGGVWVLLGLGLWAQRIENLEWGMMRLVFVYGRIEMPKFVIKVPKTARLTRPQRGEDHRAKRHGL